MAEGTAKLRERLPQLDVIEVESLGQAEPEVPNDYFALGQAPEDLALIIYTSGTTGKPKGAMLSHQNLMCNVAAVMEAVDIRPDDRMAVLLPMFHSFTMTVGLLLPMTQGVSIIAIKSLHPPKNIIAEIMQHEATVMPAIPQLYRALVNVDLPADLPLRVCLSGAAPLPVEVLNAFRERVGIPLLEGYGLSETSPVACTNPLHGTQKAGSVGVPIRGVEFEIRNDAGEVLPVGEPGEICIKGHNIMMGYWNNPEGTGEAIDDQGWMHTGDLAEMDEQGYVRIVGRAKDLIIRGGENVYPREIEEFLYTHEAVEEVQVIGVADDRYGEEIVAWVKIRPGTEVDDAVLLAFCRDRIAHFKIPRWFRLVDEFPMTVTGKIQKFRMREISERSLKEQGHA